MNNRKRIEEFLKIWAQVGIENPNFSYRSQDTHDLIYHNLIMQGVNPKDKKIDLTPTFDKWKDFFKDYSNISVFVDPKWSYFCQFVSKDPTASMQPENIKVYIPLDGEHIERGVKEIMAFLANHSISHQSKVSKKIRFDDVVVRLANESDARKLLDFIKSNSYLQKGLIAPNPFTLSENGIPLACDGSLSYNGTVASMIQMYMNNRKSQNKLKGVSYADFYDFIADCYTDEFIVQEDKPLERAFGYQNKPEVRKNYQHVISLMMKCQNPTFDFNDLVSHFRKSLKSMQSNSSEELLLECIDAMSKKYQSSRKGIVNVESYVLDNIPERLTRVNNLRTRVVNSSMREDTLRAMKKESTTFRSYLAKLMNKYNYDPTQYDNNPQK